MRMLIVDDDATFRGRLARAMESRGWLIREAGNATEAMDAARQHRPRRAVVDLRMPGEGGLSLLRRLHEFDPDMGIVVLTGYGSIATAVEAVRGGAVNYLTKPTDADQILAAFDADRPGAEEGPAPSLAQVEWEHIQRIMADCGGNVSEAARRLGIHRRSLQRKLARAPRAT